MSRKTRENETFIEDFKKSKQQENIMIELKNKLNELIEEYGLRHEKVIAYSQYVDTFIVLEQKEMLSNLNNK